MRSKSNGATATLAALRIARAAKRVTCRTGLIVLAIALASSGVVAVASAQDDDDDLYEITTLDSADDEESGTTNDEEQATEDEEATQAEATEAEEEATPSQGIEEIVVTATRRSQDLQKIATSVSSFSGSDILDRGIRNFNDLQFNVPSLFSGGGLTRITLRGVGSEIVGPGIDPGFAVHVNSVFSARETTGLLDYFDIARVDVLRGPQGTLWGRNSTGGAVNIITNRPTHQFDASADGEYTWYESGGDGGFRIRGMLNLPIIDDKLAARVALLTNFADGQMAIDSCPPPEQDPNCRGNQQRVTDAGLVTLRGSLRWEAHDDVTVDVIGSWLQNKGNGAGQKFAGSYCQDTPSGEVCFPQTNLNLRNFWAGAGAGQDYTGALPNPTDPYKGTADEPQTTDGTVWTATALTQWRAENFTMDSVFGYQSTDFFIHRDQDTSSLPISVLELTDKSRQISQELLFNSTWDKPWNYTAGAIYQYDWTPKTQVDFVNDQNTAESTNWLLYPSLWPIPGLLPDGASLADGCPPASGPPAFPGDPTPWAATCPPTSLVGDEYEDFTRALATVQNHVFGLYGNLGWEIIDRLNLNIGGRYSYTNRTWDDQTFAQSYAPVVAIAGIQVLQLGIKQNDDWNAGTWKVSADYEAWDDHLFWTSVGTGSRAGGFNFGEEDPFGAEWILAVEGGIKNMFWDDRIMFNLTGFWYDWNNPQIAATENALPVTVNAPSAKSYGVEFDWRAIPIDDFELNGSFGWLEAFYDEDFLTTDQTIQDFDQVDPTMRAKPVNLNGNRLPRSPRFTVSVGAQYLIDTGRFGTITPRIDFYYRDTIQFRQYGNPADVAPAYTRTDARIIWRSPSNHWWGELFARNLENNAVRTNQEILSSIYRVHYYAPPLNGGFRIGYNFE